MKPLIYDSDLDDLSKLMGVWAEPEYRAHQIWQGIYQQYWKKPGNFTNLPKELRLNLDEHFNFNNLQLVESITSSDGETTKSLFKMPDNQAIEAVLMRYSKRRTLCISTQSGCAMGCTFCATGQMGFRRNLSSGEIIEQVLYYAGQLSRKNERVTNIVLMGMGEPLHNYTETFQAIERLNHPNGFNLGSRRFTVSTVGLIPGIQRMAEERRQVNLAVSLHAADNDLRSELVPINRKYPIEELLSACREYVDKTRRRITFEWALISDVNDTADQARLLSNLVRGLNCHINLIPLNPTKKYDGLPSQNTRAITFKEIINGYGIPCSIRVRRGIDIQAGCGQLATDY